MRVSENNLQFGFYINAQHHTWRAVISCSRIIYIFEFFFSSFPYSHDVSRVRVQSSTAVLSGVHARVPTEAVAVGQTDEHAARHGVAAADVQVATRHADKVSPDNIRIGKLKTTQHVKTLPSRPPDAVNRIISSPCAIPTINAIITYRTLPVYNIIMFTWYNMWTRRTIKN